MHTPKFLFLSAALAASITLPAQAYWTQSTSGATTTYVENFNGGTAFNGGQWIEGGADDAMWLHAGEGLGSTSFQHTFLTDISSLTLSFWYTGSFTTEGSNPVGTVSLVRTGADVFAPVSFSAVEGTNPGAGTPNVGLQYQSPTFNNLLAGTYTLTFARGGVGDSFKIDDVVVVVTSVPEPGTVAMMLAGMGLLGAAASRRRKLPAMRA